MKEVSPVSTPPCYPEPLRGRTRVPWRTLLRVLLDRLRIHTA